MDNLDKLPAWASYNASANEIGINPDMAYPHFIGLIGLENDKYGAEVARRCAINDLIEICGPVQARILKSDEWRLANLPGTDEDAQRGANEFRNHYDLLVKKRARAALLGG